jgi:hypothetical protein
MKRKTTHSAVSTTMITNPDLKHVFRSHLRTKWNYSRGHDILHVLVPIGADTARRHSHHESCQFGHSTSELSPKRQHAETVVQPELGPNDSQMMGAVPSTRRSLQWDEEEWKDLSANAMLIKQKTNPKPYRLFSIVVLVQLGTSCAWCVRLN